MLCFQSSREICYSAYNKMRKFWIKIYTCSICVNFNIFIFLFKLPAFTMETLLWSVCASLASSPSNKSLYHPNKSISIKSRRAVYFCRRFNLRIKMMYIVLKERRKIIVRHKNIKIFRIKYIVSFYTHTLYRYFL